MNGNGDNIIGRTTQGFNPLQSNVTSLPQIETSQYWKHLALANLIAGIQPSANINNAQFGATHLASPLGGGLLVGYNNTHVGQPNTTEVGHFVLINSTASGNVSLTGQTHIKVRVAVTLDQKIDNGMPNSGGVLAEHAGSNCKTDDTPDATYRLDRSQEKNCIIFYSIGF